MIGTYGLMAGLGWIGMLMMALFWIGVIVLVVWALRHVPSPGQLGIEHDAQEILKQRYARGQISREEYLQARVDN